MCVVKGCFGWSKDHPARQHHSREEINASIVKLKEEHATALLTVIVPSPVYDIDQAGDEQLTSSDYFWTQQAKHESDVTVDSTLFFFEGPNKIEQHFAMTVGLHVLDRIDQDTDPKSVLLAASETACNPFNCITVDTCAKQNIGDQY